MKRVLAIVEVQTSEQGPEETIVNATEIQGIDPNTFAEQWNAGIQARQKWEQFCENFYQILIKSGLIDEAGLHVDEYDFGSIARFVMDNQSMLPEGFTGSALGMMVMPLVKSAGKMFKKGKEIEVNWDAINQHAGPMTEAVLNMMVMSPERRDMLLPVFTKFFVMTPVSPTNPIYPQPSQN